MQQTRESGSEELCCKCRLGVDNTPAYCDKCAAMAAEDNGAVKGPVIRHKNSDEINMLLNMGLRRIFIFEVTHQILSLLLESPPVPFFKFFDEPLKRKITCGHHDCDLVYTGKCCACLDARADKTISVDYVDGEGLVTRTVKPYASYCPRCKHAWYMSEILYGKTKAK